MDTERLQLRTPNAQLGVPVTYPPHVYIRAPRATLNRQSPHSFLLIDFRSTEAKSFIFGNLLLAKSANFRSMAMLRGGRR